MQVRAVVRWERRSRKLQVRQRAGQGQGWAGLGWCRAGQGQGWAGLAQGWAGARGASHLLQGA